MTPPLTVLQTIDAIEALCCNGAYPGAEVRIGELDASLANYLESTGPTPHVEGAASQAVLRKLLLRLRSAVERRNPSQVSSLAADLRSEVLAHHRGQGPEHAAL